MQSEVKWLMEYLDERDVLPEMQNAIDMMFTHSCKDHGYESKNARYREWNKTSNVDTYYDRLCHIFIATLTHPEGMTYQAMIGYIAGTIGCADPLDRAKCAAEIIAMAYQCELIEITRVSDKTLMITTEFELDVDIPEFDKHMPLFRKPSEVAYNPILGNRFKQHDSDVCREHIDTMNAIPLSLEGRIFDILEETTKAELETQEQVDDWEVFKVRSDLAYAHVLDKGNEFYLEHSHDTRGRCYCSGYYINYQGNSYKKAIIQLFDKEVVRL
jgi:hypothetical protein